VILVRPIARRSSVIERPKAGVGRERDVLHSDAINDGSKTKRSGLSAFCVVDLRECQDCRRNVPSDAPTSTQSYSAPLRLSNLVQPN